MASRIWKSQLKSFDNEAKIICGLVSIGSDGYVTGDTITGATASTLDGITYTITLDDAFYEVKAFNVTILAATAVDLVPQVKSQAIPTSTDKTFVFRLLAGATPTKPSAALTLSVFIVVKESSA